MSKKIICTIGPASLNPVTMSRLESLGVDLFRLNLSHTPVDEIEKTLLQLKSYAKKTPICLDSEGAQVRNSVMEGGRVLFAPNSVIKIHPKFIRGTATDLYLGPDCVYGQLRVGDLVSVDFDSVLLRVNTVSPEFIEAQVLASGWVGSNKAVSIDRPIALPAVSDKDRVAIEIGKKLGLKHIALSFANRASDVETVRELTGPDWTIISKIETKSGLTHLQEIIERSDALLIDRGDLSRELSTSRIPIAQKLIIRTANALGAPVYVATNLLESMIANKYPTRAEVNDMFNTLLDGADGLVLAAETAIGKHPVECVTIVSSMIQQFQDYAIGQTLQTIQNDIPLPAATPHGGKLIERITAPEERPDWELLPRLIASRDLLMDVEQICTGAYSPLDRFMGLSEVRQVLDQNRLRDGTLWTLPIVFQLPKSRKNEVNAGMRIALYEQGAASPHSFIDVESVEPFSLEEVAQNWFGTTSLEHPGVRRLSESGEYFVGGKVTLIKRLASSLQKYCLTPRQVRSIFQSRGWSKVVGFHSRNVAHLGHEFIQQAAVERVSGDGLFIHPVIGKKKPGDFASEVVMAGYESLIHQEYQERAVLAGFSTFSRYSGPREAVFTALCRKNFGCSHFIVGRDHTGVAGFYEPDASQKIFGKVGDIGIEPVFFNEIVFCDSQKKYFEANDQRIQTPVKLSGTLVRDLLNQGKRPPAWLMREAVADTVIEAMGGLLPESQ